MTCSGDERKDALYPVVIFYTNSFYDKLTQMP